MATVLSYDQACHVDRLSAVRTKFWVFLLFRELFAAVDDMGIQPVAAGLPVPDIWDLGLPCGKRRLASPCGWRRSSSGRVDEILETY